MNRYKQAVIKFPGENLYKSDGPLISVTGYLNFDSTEKAEILLVAGSIKNYPAEHENNRLFL
jgi:hypothetical protein